MLCSQEIARRQLIAQKIECTWSASCKSYFCCWRCVWAALVPHRQWMREFQPPWQWIVWRNTHALEAHGPEARSKWWQMHWPKLLQQSPTLAQLHLAKHSYSSVENTITSCTESRQRRKAKKAIDMPLVLRVVCVPLLVITLAFLLRLELITGENISENYAREKFRPNWASSECIPGEAQFRRNVEIFLWHSSHRCFLQCYLSFSDEFVRADHGRDLFFSRPWNSIAAMSFYWFTCDTILAPLFNFLSRTSNTQLKTPFKILFLKMPSRAKICKEFWWRKWTVCGESLVTGHGNMREGSWDQDQ